MAKHVVVFRTPINHWMRSNKWTFGNQNAVSNISLWKSVRTLHISPCIMYVQCFSLLLVSLSMLYLYLFQIPHERDTHFRAHLVKGHMKKVCGLHQPALKLCWPVGQSTKVLLPHITLLARLPLSYSWSLQHFRGHRAPLHPHRWPVLTFILNFL